MCIVIPNYSSVVFAVKGKGVFYAMRDMDILRGNVDFEFDPITIIH